MIRERIIPPTVICLLAALLLFSACERFDRSAIRMPEFSFIISENIHSVAHQGCDRIWISGNYGAVAHSSDGGKNWELQQTGVDVLLGKIVFVSPEKGWAAGVGGTVVHTADSGKTWTLQPTGAEESDLLDLFFLDETHGWAVGEWGTIIGTVDGGATWQWLKEKEDTTYNDVFFVDRKTGWVVGEFGTILFTRDGGNTWQRQVCKEIDIADDALWDRPPPALYGLYFENEHTGWITGMDGVILKTEDQGEHWRKIASGTDIPLYSLRIIGTRAWAVGNKGVYLRSTDGGETWQQLHDALKTKFWLRELSFCDEKNGVIVGAMGTVAVTEDGGVTWEIISGFSYDIEEFGIADF